MEKISEAIYGALAGVTVGYAGNGRYEVRLGQWQRVPMVLYIIAKLIEDGEIRDVQITTDLFNGYVYIEEIMED
jgi:hypothetical protein